MIVYDLSIAFLQFCPLDFCKNGEVISHLVAHFVLDFKLPRSFNIIFVDYFLFLGYGDYQRCREHRQTCRERKGVCVHYSMRERKR